ncbi:MAG TPA: response regulator [Synergistaceae bacterium]|nr:response regulator [Synergistaceae bacterium]HPQ36434.1 response regulator [Synergistaceae bacterium]
MADRPDVLICDDSLLIRKQLRDILEKTCGLQVVEADNGVNAVEVFRQHWPKIVILDIVMPAKSGLEALKEIIEIAGDRRTKIIVASSAGTEENIKEAILAGAYDFVQKPIRRERIVPLVMGILDDAEGEAH